MKHIKYSVVTCFIASLMCLFLGFYLGKFQQDILKDKLIVKSIDLDLMKKRNNQLETDLATIEITSVAEKQVVKSLMQSNKRLQDELAIANNKIHLYENIVSPELDVNGVKIHSFKISPSTQDRHWRYELVLMQSPKDRQFIKGEIGINFSIFEAAELKQVALQAFSQDITSTFNFKYFQSIEGTFIVPNDVLIDEMIISLRVDANRNHQHQKLEQHYDWLVLTNQGVDNTDDVDNNIDL